MCLCFRGFYTQCLPANCCCQLPAYRDGHFVNYNRLLGVCPLRHPCDMMENLKLVYGKEPQANSIEITKGWTDGPRGNMGITSLFRCHHSWAFTEWDVTFFLFHFYVHHACEFTCMERPETHEGKLQPQFSTSQSFRNVGLRILF